MRLASIVGVLILTVFAAPGELSAQSVAGRTARTRRHIRTTQAMPRGVPEGNDHDGKDWALCPRSSSSIRSACQSGHRREEGCGRRPGPGRKGTLSGLQRDPTDGTILAAFKRASQGQPVPRPIILTVATPPTHQPVSTGQPSDPGRRAPL